ncbi:MAG: YqgE/AlgH family protein [Candidatus Nealsonbacteria bacterium]|nr:YqgE/AlgH family protein [Candidatus Nealsonbacteria bacterium]
MQSYEGQFLVASSLLLDNNFVKTVVLLVQHSDEGALGLVVNRPTSKTVKELWREVSDAPCENQSPIHLGGPVSGPLMAVHAARKFAEIEILPGVYFTAKKENLDQLVVQKRHPLKIFAGHAGWGPGQLEHEIEEGAWTVTSASAEFVFFDGTDLWEEVTEQHGRSLLESVLKIKHIPEDPSVN